jgi:uncharacterized oxidoreductase
MQMTGNTILMTGGASGIGLALAAAFLAAGNRVIIAGRRQAALDAAVAAHPGLHAYVLDVADPAAITTFAARLVKDHPGLNVLVNNAGIMRAEDLAAPPAYLADAEATIATNFLGPIRMTAALLPHLRAKPKATIINVTSGLAFVPLAMTPTYSATKAALHSLTMSLRHQLRDTAVEVLELAPPMVQTDLMPGQATNPHGMPLADYIAEVMGLLGQTPTSPEICVGRVQFLRRAEADGQMAQVFGMLNPAG